MTRAEHLLTILAEECSEVAGRCSKALRFGLLEIQPGKMETNASRIYYEYLDVLAVMEMLLDERIVLGDSVDGISYSRLHLAVHPADRLRIDDKKAKVEFYLEYSAECGTLTRT